MPRPTTKTELITAVNTEWDKLWDMIDTIPVGAQSVIFNFGDNPKLKEAHWQRDKNMRDVLVHLYEWHKLMLEWTAANFNGEAKHFLPEPYTWKTYGDMNVGFWEKHQSTPYDEAKAMLCKSHGEIMALIERLTDEELFEKKHFSWTDGLGSYFVSVTSSHYNWAMKKIKQYVKTCV
ncbi:MAG: ClbS/DfsB family four-helix bundle protein [Peptococcaceae bacterium]|nr:ClbS/DfsB family four-helix bundle protein [Peptococcaceae bacterium]